MKKRTFEDLRERALRYFTRGEFQEKDFNAYQIASKRKIIDEICSHMPRHVDQSNNNNPNFKWTLVDLQLEADRYPDRGSFKKGSPKQYDSACSRGLLDTICVNMPRPSNKAYTVEELISIIKKYSTIEEFRRERSGAYAVAVRRTDWEEISSHMKRPSISSPEKTILEEVLKYFPEAKKFRAKKLKISGKEYIKTLEVDILVKELGKAIEYDGGWHHSFEGLKRGHPTWLDEHLAKYHEIKDGAFLELGIEILHIKQDEWKKDRQACISKCLIFLGVSSCP